MKKLLLAVLLCPALLVGCRGGNAPTEPERTALRQEALAFAAQFDTPFADPSELDSAAVGRYALTLLDQSPARAAFETDSRGYPYCPRTLLENCVEQRFGLEEYEYPIPADPDALPRYDAARDAYLYSIDGCGPRVQATLVEEAAADNSAVYTIRLDTPNIETGEALSSSTLTYRFAIVPTGDGPVLRAEQAEPEV